MWILRSDEYREYQAYKATGMTPDEVLALHQGAYPDDEDRAPLPWSDPVQEAADEYSDDWDYPREEQRRYSGLLEDEA